MLIKLIFPHQIEDKKITIAKHYDNKVKNSPLRVFIKPDPMIASEEILREVERSETYVTA